MRNPCWKAFDDTICGLVDRLRVPGYKHTLEVEFLAYYVELDEEMDHVMFPPKFKEKGRIGTVEDLSGSFRGWP